MDGASFISLGYNFLQLTINSIDEMEKQGNKSTILSSGRLNREDSWKKYEELTNWNDHNIAIPVLFNFYHGVELVLKGLYLESGHETLAKTHRLSELLQKLESVQSPPDNILLDFFKGLLSYDPNGFYQKNNTYIDEYYLLLKYPELGPDKEVKYFMIRSQEAEGLKTFTEVRELAKGVKESIRAWMSRRNTEK
jgi:HEPN domain-containing protein